METKQIEKADTSKRLPWRKTWVAGGPMNRGHYITAKLIESLIPGWDDWRRVKHDLCINDPRPHTDQVLIAREVWQRPAKLMPFKNMMPHGIKWTMRTDGVVSVQIAADLSKPTKVVRLPTLE